MKKNGKWIIWGACILVGLFAIWYFKFRERTETIVLATEKPHRGYIATSVTATGTVQPVDTVAVGTQVSGTISKVYADFNSKVSKGQLLAELDKTILNAQNQQFIAGVQQAQSQIAYQQSNYDRQSQLYKAGAISKAELETAENSFKVAQANLKSASSQLQAAQKNLSLANIYSPIEGTVLSRNVSEGQTVAASFNTPTLFSIAKDLTRMQVRAAVDEADIGSVKKGQRVTFTVDAFPDDTFEGVLLDIRLQPQVSSNVVTYTTIIDAPNGDLKLKPGMTANITIYTNEVNNALLVSAKAIRFRPDSSMMKQYVIVDETPKRRGQQTMNAPGSGPAMTRNFPSKDSASKDSIVSKRASVWVLNGKTMTRRFIRTGLEDGTQVQVLSGLSENDVVVDGMQQSGQTTQSSGSNVRSPFMPQRRNQGQGQGNRGQGGQGGNRPGR